MNATDPPSFVPTLLEYLPSPGRFFFTCTHPPTSLPCERDRDPMMQPLSIASSKGGATVGIKDLEAMETRRPEENTTAYSSFLSVAQEEEQGSHTLPCRCSWKASTHLRKYLRNNRGGAKNIKTLSNSFKIKRCAATAMRRNRAFWLSLFPELPVFYAQEHTTMCALTRSLRWYGPNPSRHLSERKCWAEGGIC